MKTFSMPGIEM